jgi:hypothetical protein
LARVKPMPIKRRGTIIVGGRARKLPTLFRDWETFCVFEIYEKCNFFVFSSSPEKAKFLENWQCVTERKNRPGVLCHRCRNPPNYTVLNAAIFSRFYRFWGYPKIGHSGGLHHFPRFCETPRSIFSFAALRFIKKCFATLTSEKYFFIFYTLIYLLLMLFSFSSR